MSIPTNIEQSITEVIDYLADKGVIEPRAIIDQLGTKENVVLAPISSMDELRAFRVTMANYLGGAFSKIIQAEYTGRIFILNINKAGKLLDVYQVINGVTNPAPTYKFSVKQDGDITTRIGNAIKQSHLALQYKMMNTRKPSIKRV